MIFHHYYNIMTGPTTPENPLISHKPQQIAKESWKLLLNLYDILLSLTIVF